MVDNSHEVKPKVCNCSKRHNARVSSGIAREQPQRSARPADNLQRSATFKVPLPNPRPTVTDTSRQAKDFRKAAAIIVPSERVRNFQVAASRTRFRVYNTILWV